MELDYQTAAEMLGQLGYVTRLKIVRELVRSGYTGMPVGDIQKNLDIPNSTLSHHLGHLRQVGLIRQERKGTLLRCFVDFNKIGQIIRFLTKECCVEDNKKIKGK
jgi:DNA-binding transcriptional ArsR family regulator